MGSVHGVPGIHSEPLMKKSSTCAAAYTWYSPRKRPLVTQLIKPYAKTKSCIRYGLLSKVWVRYCRPSPRVQIRKRTLPEAPANKRVSEATPGRAEALISV